MIHLCMLVQHGLVAEPHATNIAFHLGRQLLFPERDVQTGKLQIAIATGFRCHPQVDGQDNIDMVCQGNLTAEVITTPIARPRNPFLMGHLMHCAIDGILVCTSLMSRMTISALVIGNRIFHNIFSGVASFQQL